MGHGNQTRVSTENDPVEVSEDGTWVVVRDDRQGIVLRLYPDQARMLSRVMRGLAGEIDQRG